MKDFSPRYIKDAPHPALALNVGTGCKLCAAGASYMNVISREPGLNGFVLRLVDLDAASKT